MTRRTFGSCAAALLLQGTGTKYGAVDVDRHRVLCGQGIHLHVIHDGIDVTNRCVFADDTGTGHAVLLKHRDGRPYYDRETDEPAKEIIHGITFREGRPF